jgi:hypothetical protein
MAEINKGSADSKPKKVVKKKTKKSSIIESPAPGVPPPAPPSATSPVPDSPIIQPAAPVISPQEVKNLQEMTQLARLEYFKALNTKIVREKKREISSLDSQIREFLGPYILIGYDLNNQPVEVVSAQNPAEHDALLERFRRVMYKINQNIVNSNGEDPYGNGNDT